MKCMIDPVIDSYGFTYERAAFLQCLAQRPHVCPMTNVSYPCVGYDINRADQQNLRRGIIVTPNRLVQNIIQELVRANLVIADSDDEVSSDDSQVRTFDIDRDDESPASRILENIQISPIDIDALRWELRRDRFALTCALVGCVTAFLASTIALVIYIGVR
ncbi:hypothetical protein CYMTET_54264 [Cymbomonas tetramitiformis]|uniref:U-box domain-containing protein n=1 Tax=Cymbomonas tetramitiformis TaxID=36881 RepID=A0AAE0BH38_9CHLO|nr:hypothetical protein CYMTET_54264 [Cymbomonas tetramitiformis]